METAEKNHKFGVRIVDSGDLLEKALRLRRKVFFNENGKDEDLFDKACHHLVVIENETEQVVGTYRLLLRSSAEKHIGFYSETEFNLQNVKKNCRGELLELGRACVDPHFRKFPILPYMWRAIIEFTEKKDVNFIFGCASIDEPTPEKIGQIYNFFKENYFAGPELKVQPLEGKFYPYDKNIKHSNPSEMLKSLPVLIKGYLKIGAFVCGEPMWDKVFNTADFFMMAETKKMSVPYKNKFL